MLGCISTYSVIFKTLSRFTDDNGTILTDACKYYLTQRY